MQYFLWRGVFFFFLVCVKNSEDSCSRSIDNLLGDCLKQIKIHVYIFLYNIGFCVSVVFFSHSIFNNKGIF